MRSENQEGLPSHAPKRTNGADRRNDHSGRTQQGAQQPAGTKNRSRSLHSIAPHASNATADVTDKHYENLDDTD